MNYKYEWVQTGGLLDFYTTSAVSSNKVYMVTMGNGKINNINWPTISSCPVTTSAQTAMLGGQAQLSYGGITRSDWLQYAYGAYGNYAQTGSFGLFQEWATPETAAQKAARLEREARRKAAEQRAEHLLFSILTPAQVKQYTDDAYFDVPMIDRVYRIKRGVSRNIEVIEAGKVRALLCAHPSDAHQVPIPDVMLSQLLALRADEQAFLRVANRTVVQ